MARHRILPPFYFLGCVIAAALLHRYLPLVEVVPSPLNWAGAVLVVVGVGFALWASVLFKRLPELKRRIEELEERLAALAPQAGTPGETPE